MTSVTPLNAEQTASEGAQAKKDSYAIRVLVALDMTANVVLGGEEDETISSNSALMARKHEFLGVVMSRMLNLFQANHGAKAAAGDLERAEAVERTLLESGVVVAPAVVMPVMVAS